MFKQSKSKLSLVTFMVAIFTIFGVTSIANSSTSPFAQNDTNQATHATKGDDHAEKKCGEGKCGDKNAEEKCGEGKCGDKNAEKKCGEGKCGDKKDGKKCDGKKAEGKCGEGKCGDKKAEGKCAEKKTEGKCAEKKAEGKCGTKHTEENNDKSDSIQDKVVDAVESTVDS